MRNLTLAKAISKALTGSLTFVGLATSLATGLALSGGAYAKDQQKYLVQFAPNYVAQPTFAAKKDIMRTQANYLAHSSGVTISKLYSNSGIASVYATRAQLAQLKKNDNIVNIVRADAKVDIQIPKVETQSIKSPLRQSPLGQPSLGQSPQSIKSQNVGSWGIDRIDQRDRNYDGKFNAPFDGSDVIVYVMDSGVEMDHPMLKDRVAYTKNTYNPDVEAFDCHGHGTHVIGTVGVQDYGVAPGATLVAIRPFNDNCGCLLYTSPSPRDMRRSRMPSSA